MKVYLLERTQTIPLSPEETFAFFSDAFNLERITPPFLRFRILTPPPIQMKTGVEIEYRLKLFGVPIYWRTRIEDWVPNEIFVDTQIIGPYALWHHTHTFEEQGPGQTLMRDRVQYRIPFSVAGNLAHVLFVKRLLKRIFDYRAAMTAQLLGQKEKGESFERHRAIAGESSRHRSA